MSQDRDKRTPNIPIREAVRVKTLLDQCENRGVEVELIEREGVEVKESIWGLGPEAFKDWVDSLYDAQLKKVTEHVLFELNKKYKIVKGPEKMSGRDR